MKKKKLSIVECYKELMDRNLSEPVLQIKILDFLPQEEKLVYKIHIKCISYG